MPELPEVETMRRGIVGVVDALIDQVDFHRTRHKPIQVSPSRAAFRRRVLDKKVLETGRLGKRVLLRLESDLTVVLEPRMTGLVLVTDPPNREHLRLTLTLTGSEHSQLMFWDRRGLGSVHVYNRNELDERLGPEKLGPDALAVTVDQIRSRLCTSKRAVKVALLDQRAVAGIGNLYASEILHLAGVHPAKRCDRISKPKWAAIHEALLSVLRTAIRYEGSTLADGTYRNALNQDGSFQNHHRVYDRAGQPCGSCGNMIRRIVQAQRSTFFCPKCQKK
jgi:formamidopyrimidine-DNA glycosylase